MSRDAPRRQDPSCPFCGGPIYEAPPDTPPPTEACVDRECKGAHGWEWHPALGAIPLGP